jgi:PEP-CTERM motif
MKSALVGALALATTLAAGAAFATTTTMSTGFLPTYIGPQNGDVEIASASASVVGTNLVLSATAMAPIGTTTGEVNYIWGIDTDPAKATAPFSPEGFNKVVFNDVSVASVGAPGVTVSGDTITDTISIASLSNVVLSPGQFAISLWPDVGSPGVFAGFSEFVPGNGTFSASVPEPASWAIMLVGFGALGAVMRQARRKSPAVA